MRSSATALPPPALAPRAALALIGGGLALFALLAADLLGKGPVTLADPGLGGWLQHHSHPLVTQAMVAIAHLHGTAGLLLLATLVALLLAAKGYTAWLPALLASVPGGMLLNVGVKHVFQRARPAVESPLPSLASYSFPSGHTAGATVFYGFLLVLVLAHRPAWGWRAAATAAVVAAIGLTAYSRVYLGMHYPSDVLAAAALGGAWLALCFLSLGRLRRAAGKG